MATAIEALLADHRMIRKTLEGFALENPRFPVILPTLSRIVTAHGWFEDKIFLPALQKEPLLNRLSQEISQEHEDMTYLFKQIHAGVPSPSREQEGYVLQLRSILTTHFLKEEEALFPLAERILDSEGLNRIGDEMVRRRAEAQNLPPV